MNFNHIIILIYYVVIKRKLEYRHTERETDRQTDRQTNKQIVKRIERNQIKLENEF